MKRRTFIKSGVLLGSAGSLFSDLPLTFGQIKSKPVVISSGNGERATAKAMTMIKEGGDALDAVIAGVNIIEDDPEDVTVGLGGLPNEDGMVELDACCMHGPTHNAGAVASLRNIKNPSRVARLVMERTDHVLIVGEGALRFAKAHGFDEVELLTEKSRQIWLNWKENLNPYDDWLPPEETSYGKSKSSNGTITCCAVDLAGNISGVTTTSGLSFKIPGRVGDSPIIGAGLYVDNQIGACGSTGRGEENLKNLSCVMVVEYMGMGNPPEEACLKACKRIIDHAKITSILKDDGKPNFNVTFYAIDKAGHYGCGSIYGPKSYALHDGNQNRLLESAYLFEND